MRSRANGSLRAGIRREVGADRTVVPVLKSGLRARAQAVIAVRARVCHPDPAERFRGNVLDGVGLDVVTKADRAVGEPSWFDRPHACRCTEAVALGWPMATCRDPCATVVLKLQFVDFRHTGLLAILGAATFDALDLAAVWRLSALVLHPFIVAGHADESRCHASLRGAQPDFLRNPCGIQPISTQRKGPLSLQTCRSEAVCGAS